MKKIMIVTPYFYPKIGGLENYVQHVISGLTKKFKWDIIVVTSSIDGNKYKEETLNKIKVYRLPYLIRLSNTPVNPFWFFSVKKIIKKEKPDVINTHSPVPFLADVAVLSAGSIPVVVTYHAGSMIKNSFLADLIIGTYEKFVLPHIFSKAHKIVYYSKEFYEKFLTKHSHKTIEISPGVNTEQFQPPERFTPNLSVAYAGKLDSRYDWKGVIHLLKAMQDVLKVFPDAKLNLIGGGNAIEDYKKKAKELGIAKSVSFSGELSGKALANEYKKNTILVLPSVSNAESFGMVLIEAMACGVAVIGSNIGGIPGVVDHKVNGFLTPPADSKKLAKAIVNLLSHPETAKQMGEQGRKKALGFDWVKKVEQYDTLFTTTIEKKNVVYQISAYYPPKLGGMEKCAQIIARALAKRDRKTHVLTSNIGLIDQQKESQKNLAVSYFNSIEFAHTPISIGYLFYLLKIKKPAIFHLHVANAYFVDLAYFTAIFKRIPYVAHIHIDPGASGKFGFLLPIYKNLILKPLLRNANKIICLTQSQKKQFMKMYNLDSKKIVVLPNGVDDEFFIEKSKSTSSVTDLLFVGRLSIQKNIPVMLKALQYVKSDVQLHIVGEGDERKMIEEQIKTLKLKNVHLHGALFGKSLLKKYQQSDIFLFPSFNEGMSLALLEAMASGMPVVTSGLEQNIELLGDGALYVDNQNARHYAAAIDTIINDQAQKEKMSAANRENALNFRWDNIVSQIVKIYSTL